MNSPSQNRSQQVRRGGEDVTAALQLPEVIDLRKETNPSWKLSTHTGWSRKIWWISMGFLWWFFWWNLTDFQLNVTNLQSALFVYLGTVYSRWTRSQTPDDHCPVWKHNWKIPGNQYSGRLSYMIASKVEALVFNRDHESCHLPYIDPLIWPRIPKQLKGLPKILEGIACAAMKIGNFIVLLLVLPARCLYLSHLFATAFDASHLAATQKQADVGRGVGHWELPSLN